jgi:dTMP kinase
VIIALEGPSYAGKTTALRHLRTTGLVADALILECYVRSIPRPEDIPRPATESADEQLTAFDTFMAVEERRVLQAAAHQGPVILDRSVDTLLAHASALDRMYSFDVFRQLRERLDRLPHLRPDHTLYLDVSAETLALRRKAAGHTATEPEYFLHDPRFLGHTRSYFCMRACPPVAAEVAVMPGDGSAQETAAVVQSLITHWTSR